MRLGALEAGGTKLVCAIGNEKGEILEKISLPTGTPDMTLPPIIDYFNSSNISALGIGSFGPIDLDRYIVPTSLNDNQGIMGCIQLALLSL